MAARTPPERDRYVDFLRGVSILAVVAGHWTIATIQRGPHGIEVGNVLSHAPALRPVTWVFQVMGVFFVVGGFSTRRAIEGRATFDHATFDRATFDRGAFFAGRVERLLRPTLAFVAVWLVAAFVLQGVGVDDRLTHAIARIAAQPLWFLAVYLLVTLIAPAQLALHRRAPAAMVVALPIGAVIFDALRFTHTAPGLAVLNYLLVFAFAQELGFHLSVRWDRIGARSALAASAGAFAVMVLLVTVGPYPASMVGLPGARVSNMSPPTVCILLLTIVHTGLLTALRPAGRRLLQRPRVWIATVAVNAGIMTIFLWHLTAAATVGAVFYAMELLPVPGSVNWWLLKIPWFVGCLVVLAVVVSATVGIERLPAWSSGQRGHAWVRALGTLIGVRGLAGFAVSGFDHPFTARGQPFLGLTLSPVVDVALVAAGYVLASWLPARRDRGREFE